MAKTTQQQTSTLRKKLDKLIQLKLVPLNPTCLVCGGKTSEMHHYIQKERSPYLRYQEKNLIPLCKYCHASHHLSGDPRIVEIIVAKRGKKWTKWIQDHRNIFVKRDKFYLEELKLKIKNYGM